MLERLLGLLELLGHVVLSSNPLNRFAWPIASWKSSSMKMRPLACSLARSPQEPVRSPTLSSRQAIPVVYIPYGTVWAESLSYQGSSKNG